MENPWTRAWHLLRDDFADVPSFEQILVIIVRLLIAAAVGGLLGWQREWSGKPAGLRTHMLVSLGAALFLLIPQQAGMSLAGLSRVIQGLVAGVGFLGAGAIIKMSGKERVKGLTTAADIWLTAALGMAAGLGRETSAILGAILAFAILTALVPLERWIGGRKGPSRAGGGRRGRILQSHE